MGFGRLKELSSQKQEVKLCIYKLIETLNCEIDLRGNPYSHHYGNRHIFEKHPNVHYSI